MGGAFDVAKSLVHRMCVSSPQEGPNYGGFDVVKFKGHKNSDFSGGEGSERGEVGCKIVTFANNFPSLSQCLTSQVFSFAETTINTVEQ